MSNAGAARLGRLLLPGIFCVAIAACGSAPTVGDQIIVQGKGTAAIGTAWNQGSKMVADGQALAAKGRQQIKDGQDNIKAGDDMVARGKALMAQAEAQYKAAQAHPSSVAIPANRH